MNSTIKGIIGLVIFAYLAILLNSSKSPQNMDQISSNLHINNNSRFKLVGSSDWTHLLLVNKGISQESLEALLQDINCARISANLDTMGIPPTTANGKMGMYALINLYIFDDPLFATVQNYTKWIKSDLSDKSYGTKIVAFFNYNKVLDKTYMSIGMPKGSLKGFNNTFKKLEPLNIAECVQRYRQ